MRRLTWILIAVGLLAFGPAALDASNVTYWQGDEDTDWGTAGNWTNGVPTDEKNAIFDDASSAGDCVIGVGGGVCAVLIFKAGSTQTLSMSGALVCDSVEIRSAFSIDDGGQTVTVAGGIYVADGDSVTLTSTGVWTQSATGTLYNPDTSNALAVFALTDGTSGTIVGTTSGAFCCRQITIGQGDSLTGAGALNIVLPGCDYIGLSLDAHLGGTGPLRVYQDWAANYTPIAAAFTTSRPFVFIGATVDDTCTLGGTWTCDSMHLVTGCFVQGANAVQCRGCIIEDAVDFVPGAAEWTVTGGSLKNPGSTAPFASLTVNADSSVAGVGDVYCTALTIAAGDSLLFSSGQVYFVSPATNFLTVGAGGDIDGTVTTTLDASISLAALSIPSASFRVNAAVACSLSMAGNLNVESLFVFPAVPFLGADGVAIDMVSYDLTADMLMIAVDGGIFAAGSGTHTIGGVSYFGSVPPSQPSRLFCGTGTSDITGDVDCSYILVTPETGSYTLSGSAGQSVTLGGGVGSHFPALVNSNSHASGVTFADAMTCSSYTATGHSHFAAGETHTAILALSATGTAMQDFDSSTPGTQTTVSFPGGSDIHNCTVSDIIGTNTVPDCRGCRVTNSVGINLGGE